MKIIRFLTEANNICYGVVSSQEDEKANLIKGNIFETFFVIVPTYRETGNRIDNTVRKNRTRDLYRFAQARREWNVHTFCP